MESAAAYIKDDEESTAGDGEKKDRKTILAEALEQSGDYSEAGEQSNDISTGDEGAADKEPAGDAETPDKSAKAPEADEKEPKVLGILPPAELDAEAKKEFEELAKANPELARKYSSRFYDMRRDYTAKTTELAQHRQKYQQLDQISQAHAGRLARKGVTVEQAISNALAWDDFIEQQGANAALQWLEKHGLDPEELIEARDSGEAYSSRQQQTQLPPEVARELEESRRFREQWTQQQHSQVVDSAFSAITQFKANKPVFMDPSTGDQIEAAMAPIVNGLRMQNPNTPPSELLERAYSYVMKGDDRFQALADGANQRQKVQAERDRTTRARQATSHGGSGPGAGSPTTVPKGRKAQLAAALDGRLSM
jgi:hypothetical protein